ncbi:MAG: helical backbone metal receptor [Edaphocola sp.]
MVLAAAISLLASCGNHRDVAGSNNENTDSIRIVSLNGAISETLAGLGMEANIVGVDVTSKYPQSLLAKPKVGSPHNMSVEAMIALKPNYVIAMKERGLKPEQAAQLQQAGIKVWVIEQEYSVEGTKKYINQLADSFHKQEAAKSLTAAIDSQYAALPKYETSPKVMFIYARGAGALSVCGKNMPMAIMIALAGGTNAGNDAEGFKPLTPEAVVKANPDAILLFDSGLKSLDGVDGMLKVPGIAQTKAGKDKNFIVMDGELLSAFGPRVVSGIKELGEKIHANKALAE